MRVLLIDGEYYRKLYGIERLQEIIERFIGVINYPDKVLYYSTCVDSIRKELYNVKNLEVNDKGYISGPCKGTKIQKAVDGYIIKDLILLSQDANISDIYLIAGDGDLIPGIEYSQENGKNLTVISCIDNTAERIKELVNIFDFKKYLDTTTENQEVNLSLLSEKSLMLKKMWLKEKDNENWLSSTTIGQNRKKYNFTYTKGKLQVLLNQLEEASIIIQQKETIGPGCKIQYLNVS